MLESLKSSLQTSLKIGLHWPTILKKVILILIKNNWRISFKKNKNHSIDLLYYNVILNHHEDKLSAVYCTN